MLLDDDVKFVELIMENIMWGNITINWEKIRKKERVLLATMMGNYIRLHKKGFDDPELKKLIKKLSSKFKVYRVGTNAIVGELQDRDHVNKIECLKDNKQSTERLR